MSFVKESYHLQSDKRQFGGMLMLLGFCAIIQPMANIVSGFGPDGANSTDPSEIPFWGLVGAFCLFINGILGVFTGYTATVHDWSHQWLTGLMILTIQTAFIPYVTDMTAVGKNARLPAANNTFIPLEYEPTDDDVKFVGAMGVLAILTYGFAFVGAISFMVFCLHSYNTGKPEDRSGAYFQGRLGFYSGILALGGLVQMMLGAYCRVQFGMDILRDGPVRAAMLTVTYPTISIFMGLIQVLNGIWGIARSVGFHQGTHDVNYQVFLAVQWVLVLSVQGVAQIAYLPGGELAAAAPTFVAISLGINLMPAFLDHKMRTLPLHFSPDYYTVATCEKEGSEGTMSKEAEPTVSKEFADPKDLDLELATSQESQDDQLVGLPPALSGEFDV